MTRRTYGLLSMAQRHPRMFAALYGSALDKSDVEDGSDGRPRANDAMLFAQDCDAALVQLRTLRGEPYVWGSVPWRTDAKPERRRMPGPSRWSDL